MADMIVTANRLSDGAVVYLAAEGRWTPCLERALVVAADAVAPLLAMAERAVADRLVVAPYEFPVVAGPQGIRPTQMREVIRAAGPTTHPQFGRQAALPCAAE